MFSSLSKLAETCEAINKFWSVFKIFHSLSAPLVYDFSSSFLGKNIKSPYWEESENILLMIVNASSLLFVKPRIAFIEEKKSLLVSSLMRCRHFQEILKSIES